MNILYIHQYFRTPEEGGSTRSYELARGLMEEGHTIIMLTAHHHRKGIYHIDGIEVHYLKIPYRNEYGFLKRVFAFLLFVRLAKKESKKLTGIDMAYVMTTPLTTGLIALHLKKKYQIPYIFEVGDLWPEAPIQMGVIKNEWLVKKLYAFEKRCYLQSEKVVCLSPTIESYVKQITREKETQVITNLSDCDYFKPSDPNPEVFRIGYFGTFGKANDLQQILNLANYLQNTSIPVEFTLMGHGAEERQLRQRAQNLKNLEILPFGNKDQVRSAMEKMDAVYISFKSIPVLNTGSPNKLFDGLAAGKLIIINFGGWIKELIEKHRCGFAYEPQQPHTFIGKITPFLTDQKLLATYQQNSRKLAEDQYEKKLLIKKLNKVINRST